MAAAMSHFGDVRGKRLLDLGCGLGEAALAFAGLGAQVTAIDTSQTSINRLNAYCTERGITNFDGRCMSAFDIESFEPFDVVFGKFILHHLEPFDEFASVLERSIVPGGRAFFLENNAGIGSAALFFRQHLAGKGWFPKYGDDEEFPLTGREVDALRRLFEVEVIYPELLLFRKISQYIFRWKVFPGTFEWLDHFSYRFPPIRPFSYHQYILLDTIGINGSAIDGAPFS
jgi:SAM-dependent methyltransferase